MISNQQILAYMESGKVFSCKVVAFNRGKKKGGQVKDYPEAILVQATSDKPKTGRPPTEIEQLKKQLEDDPIKKDPNHRANYTRNIRECQDGFPTSLTRTIHIPLILEFNGQTVTP